MSESDVVSPAREPLAVVGLSCLFPKANHAEEFWSNIRRGVDAITEVPSSHWSAAEYFDADPKAPDMTYARRGGFLSPVDFDPLEFGIAPSNLEAIDTSQLLGLVGAKRALEDAGYGAERQFDRSRVGCILGVTGTLEMVIPLGARLGHPKWRQALKDAGIADDVAADVMERISESYVPWQENSFPGLLGNVVAGRIANRLDLGGTNCVVDAACASSLSAMHLAALELWSGRSDMVVTGGIDTFNDIFMYMCFSKTPALSPTGDAKPFSDLGDGTILGEGVGIVVLKRLSDAERDGDRIYALIRGIGTSSDGAGNAVYAPKKEGQIRCLQDAYQIAGISPETIELVEAHGTGTKVGDATELAGLTEVFQTAGQSRRWCAVGSIKSQIGHTKAAAGSAGVLKAILALKHCVLPPTIKIDRPLPALLDEQSPLYANTQARPWLSRKEHPRRAGVSAFGFGGSNFHCVLEESPKNVPAIDWDGDVLLAAWSADRREDLSSQLSAWQAVTDRKELRKLAAKSRQMFQPQQEHRLVIVADLATADVPRLIATAQSGLRNYADRSSWSTPDGISYGSGRLEGKLGLLFPGQGSQYVGMQRELACRFPMLQDVLAEANEVFAELSPEAGKIRLSDYIYPIPAFDDATKDAQESALRNTEIAQPALGAVSLGLLAIMAQFGVKPDVVAGHSYGELTALCAAKRFRPEALYRLSMLRGKLMSEAQDVDGGMLAVGAPFSQVEAAMKESAVDLVIANRNSPTQVVLSGRIDELDRANEIFARQNIRGKRLPVAAAFHSPLVATASQRFRPVLDAIEFLTPEVPVYANTHAEEYPDDADEARSLLAGQLAQPVEFVQQIENMYESGVRLFLEVGPGAVLTGLVGSILSGKDHRAIAVDATSGKRTGMLDLAIALGHLGAAGYSVNLSTWDPPTVQAETRSTNGSPRMTIPICGANYVKPRTPRPAVKRIEKATPRFPEEVANRPVEPRRPIVDREIQTPVAVPSLQAPQVANKPPTTQTLSPALQLLQQMHEQTSRLHQQFLVGQEAALRTLESLATGRTIARDTGTPVTETRLSNVDALAPRPQYAVLSTNSGQQAGGPWAVDSGQQEAKSGQPESKVPQPSTLDSQLETDVLAVVAEKTGYPAEMLKPEMSLDHDLGIDSIKRVEILSALQERRPDLPTVQPEQLGTLHRLSDVIELLNRGQWSVDSGQPAENKLAIRNPQSAISQPSTLNSQLAADVLAVVAEKTGYPAEMLKPEMSLDHDLGIDSIKRVEILSSLQERRPDLPTVQPEQLGTLHRLSDVIELLNRGQWSVDSGQPAENKSAIRNPQSEIPSRLSVKVPQARLLATEGTRLPFEAGATFFLTDDGSALSLRLAERFSQLGYRARLVRLDEPSSHAIPDDLAGLIVVAPERGITDSQLWRALEWCQKCGPALRRSGKQAAALFATISRLDGQFGLGSDRSMSDPLSGALAGLAKTARHEWPEISSKALDWPASADEINDLVDHLLQAGPVEIGKSTDGWLQIEVDELPMVSEASSPIHPGELVVITGGARGVTAAAAMAVAKAWRPTLVLCGRTPLADAEPEEFQNLQTATQIKQAIAQRNTSGLSLRQIDQQAKQVLANREVRATLETIRQLGVPVEYRDLDVRDSAAVRNALVALQKQYGPVRGVIHGAGVLEDRRIEDKTREQFDSVYATKMTGLRNLLAAIDPAELKCLAVFSSYTARFGRTGQVDYAMANEALNKLAGKFQQDHPLCRVRSFNWGPWDGGMVTDSLKPLFAKEGVGLIPLEAGAQVLVDCLEQPNGHGVEVLVLAENSGQWAEGSGQPDRGRRKAEGGQSEEKSRQWAVDSGQPEESQSEIRNPSTLDSQLATEVLAVIAEKTGYPVEMLKPEMSLDHDLGIDSIKRVEILSALQERRPDLPVVKPEQLGTLHRVSDVISLLNSGEQNSGQWTGDRGQQEGNSGEWTVDSRQPAENKSEIRNPQSELKVTSATRSGWERTVDLAGHPYLASHVIGGKAVFPTAMMLECLGHAALHHHPGLELIGVDALRIFKGIRLSATDRVLLKVATEKAVREGRDFRIPVRLISMDHSRETLHAQADVVLSGQRPAAPSAQLLRRGTSPMTPPDHWYDSLLFHGPELHGLQSIESLSHEGIAVWSSAAPSPARWLSEPWRTAWLTDPLVIDVVLQALIVWTQTQFQRASLPTAIAGYRQYRRSFPSEGAKIVLQATRRNDATVFADAEILDRAGELVASLTGIEYVLDAQLNEAFRKNRLT